MKHICRRDFGQETTQEVSRGGRSPYVVFTLKNISACPIQEGWASSVPLIMRAKDPCLKPLHLSSQKRPKILCNVFKAVAHHQISWQGGKSAFVIWLKANWCFLNSSSSRWSRHRCSEFPFPLRPACQCIPRTFLPGEGRGSKRHPSDPFKSGSSIRRRISKCCLASVFPVRYSHFSLSLILKSFQVHNTMSSICLTKCHY